MQAVRYMTGQMAELAMNVVVGIIATMRGVTIIWHNGTAIDADIFTKTIRIPRVSCASMLTYEALMLMRGGVYHEAGHLLFTKLPKTLWPKGALMEIWNGVEDRWMEAEMRKKFPGAKVVLPWMSKYYNAKIAKQILGDEKNPPVDAPLWEALCAMGFMGDGIVPAWRLTPKAQLYYDAGYTTFIKWKNCKSSKDTLKVAEELYDILKDVNEECKEDAPQEGGQGKPQNSEGEQGEPQQGNGQGEGESQQGEGQQGEGGEPQSGDSNEGEGEPQQGGKKDFDDYENEQGKSKSGEGEGDESGEEKSKGSEAGDEDGDKAQEGGSKGESGKDDNEGAEGDKSAESGESGNEKGEGESGEGDDAEGDDSVEGAGNPGDGTYKPDTTGTDDKKSAGHEEGDTGNRTWEEIAAMETAMGKDIKETVNEELAEQLTGMAEDRNTYLARRDLDEHIIPSGSKSQYEYERKQISSAVMVLTRALDQSLRILSKKRKSCGRRHGSFDQRRLVQAATGLSKNVFYKTSQGITLDTVVSIVIDESGSMGNMHEVRRMAIAIGEALTKIGVEFEIVGTTTKHWSGHKVLRQMDGFDRTNPIMYRHYKIFGEQWHNVAQRVTEMSARQHNVDGEAVEYCAFRLAQRKEKRKVIFSICDGEPYAGHSNSHVMAKNLKDVCKKVRESGIEVYGFGIGEEGPRAYYGEENFIYLEDSAALGPEFVRRFASIVTGGRVKIGKAA